MKKIFTLFILLSFAFIFANEPHFMYDPEISGDGETVCFVYMQNIWSVPFEGGQAKRLTSTEGMKSDMLISKDSKKIAFMSNQNRYNSLFIMPLNGGKAEKISSEVVEICSWYNDNKHLLVKIDQIGIPSSYAKLNIKTKKLEIITEFAGSFSSLSPNEDKIVFCRWGKPFRERYNGSTNGDLWEYDIKNDKYTELSSTKLTERYPVFSNTIPGKIYFSFSDGEVFQINSIENNDFDNYNKLTNFKDWSARDLSIAYENDRIVYEHFDKIGFYNPKTKKFGNIEISINEDYLENPIVIKDLQNKADNFAISPNGKLIVFSYKFDLFAVPEKGGEVKQITFDQKGIDEIEIMGDNETIFFTSYKKGKLNLFKTNIKDLDDIENIKKYNKFSINYLEVSADDRLFVSYSKNESHRFVDFSEKESYDNFENIDKNVRDFSNVNTKTDQILYTILDYDTWSKTLYLYNIETGKKQKIFKKDSWISNIYWAESGKSAFMNIGSDIVRLDFEPKNDFPDEKDHWESILSEKEEEEDSEDKEEKEEKIEKPNFDLENIKTRYTKLVSKDDWNWIIRVDDENIYYINRFKKNQELRKVDYFGEEDKKITTMPKNYRNLSFNKDNKSYYLISGSNINKWNESVSKKEIIEFDFSYTYNRLKLNQKVWEHVWSEFGRTFYKADMHGVNWEKIHKKYKKYENYLFTPRHIGSLADEMIGEVDASHTGYYPRKENYFKTFRKAYLGVEFDFKNSNKNGIIIKKIYKDSKLNKPFNIKAGDVLLSIDGKKINHKNELSELLLNKTGKKIKLKFKTENGEIKAEIKGLSYSVQYRLYYDNWVNERKMKTAKYSGGKIGYLHIQGMNQRCLKKFKEEMASEMYDKEAIIIDIRNNGGGNISTELLNILNTKNNGFSTTRSDGEKFHKTPENYKDKPKALLINKNSFSDAEVFPHFFKYHQLGTVIGMPTSGSVIGTWSHKFIDGSSMRVPGSGWYFNKANLDEKFNMEGNGCQPDIKIDMTPEQIIKDNDVQLKKAIEVLLEKIK